MIRTDKLGRRGPLSLLLGQARLSIPAGFLLLLVCCALFDDALAPYSADQQNLRATLQPPSAAHWLGTDTLGRDVLSRLLYGIEPTLVGVVQALAVFLAVGVPAGLVAGYRGGKTDIAIVRVAEIILSIPPIVIVLVVLAAVPGSSTAAMVCLGILGAPALVRVTRAAAAKARSELFVTAAWVAGTSSLRILRTHILRRVRGPVIVQASIFAGVALGFQAALSFLGLVSGGSGPTWGAMVGEASTVITQTTWLLVPSGLAITCAVLAFGFLGDVARDLSSDSEAETKSGGPNRHHARLATPAAAPLPNSEESADTALLSVRGLTVRVKRTDTELVTDVGFDLRSGSTLALVGESGCGKSITALSVLGLLPAGVDIVTGSIRFAGTELVGRGTVGYRLVRGAGIGYVSQDPSAALDPMHTIGSHLDEIIRRHGVGASRSARRERAVELLERVRIQDPARVLPLYPHQISGGMAQRVSIAIALAGSPKLLLADEPTTALDVTVQAEILSLLRELQERTGMAILLITHDWGVVADLSDSAVVMYAGEVVEQASINRIFASPVHPYTRALLAADPGNASNSRLPVIPGRVPPPGSWPSGCRFAARCAVELPGCRTRPIDLVRGPDGATTRCVRVTITENRAST